MYTSPALCLGLILVKGMEASVVVAAVVKGSVVSFAFLGETVSCIYKKLLCYYLHKMSTYFFPESLGFWSSTFTATGKAGICLCLSPHTQLLVSQLDLSCCYS